MNHSVPLCTYCPAGVALSGAVVVPPVVQVKAEPDSSSMRGLQAAGNAVKQATDHLVRAAQRSIAQEQEFQLVINRRMVGGIAQEIGAREEILRKERELEEARERLAALRRAKYGSNGPDGLL